MTALADAGSVPLAVASVLLVLAGVPKVFRPHDLRRALRQAGVRVPGAAVRLAGAAEACLGVAALLVSSRLLAVAVALSYVAFTAFVGLALRRDWALSTCGCFGREDTPPSRLHALLTGAVAVGVGVAALAGTPALSPALAGSPLLGLPLVALVALVAWLLLLALTALPRLGVRLAALTGAAVGEPSVGAPAAFRLLPVTDVSPWRVS